MNEQKRQNAERRKPAILKAFYDVIESEGFENASVAKVAARAGVHPSLIIHYFETKEKMVMALVDDVLLTYSRLVNKIPGEGRADKQLEKLLNLMWSREWYGAASFSVIFSFLALSQRHQDVAARVFELYGRFKTFLTRQLTLFAEAGVIQIDNPENTAEVLIAMCEGSHYFCQYFTTPEAFESHHNNMIVSAKKILGVPPSKNNFPSKG